MLNDPKAVGLRAASIFKGISKIAVASKGRFSVAVSVPHPSLTFPLWRDLGIHQDAGC